MRLTPEREKQLRKLHTDNRYGVLELLEEIQALNKEKCFLEHAYEDERKKFQAETMLTWNRGQEIETLKNERAIVETEYHKASDDRDALLAKLARTQEHHEKQRQENNELEQKVFDEQEEVIVRLKNALEDALAMVPLVEESRIREEYGLG